MTDHPRFDLLNMSLTLVINLLLGFWLIPQYGAFGAAIVSAISIAFINTLRLVEVYLLLHIQPYNLTYFKPVVAGLLAASTTVLVGQLLPDWPAIWRLGSLGLILGLIYLLVLLALGLDENDQVIIQAVQRRFRMIYAALATER
jgi:O-antigen/teichoic acid export membrane protein